MFKQFLRIDATADEVRIRCFAVSGCGPQENEPPVEDDLVARRAPDGTWELRGSAEDAFAELLASDWVARLA